MKVWVGWAHLRIIVQVLAGAVSSSGICAPVIDVMPNLSWIAVRDPGVFSTWYFG